MASLRSVSGSETLSELFHPSYHKLLEAQPKKAHIAPVFTNLKSFFSKTL
jgi:hypothetical protein